MRTQFYGVTIVTGGRHERPIRGHPTTGELGNSGCHTTTPPFSCGRHSRAIPTSEPGATCSNCHTATPPATTTMKPRRLGSWHGGASRCDCAPCHGLCGTDRTTARRKGQAEGHGRCTPPPPTAQPGAPPNGRGGASAGAALPSGRETRLASLCHHLHHGAGGFKGHDGAAHPTAFMDVTRKGKGQEHTGSSTPQSFGL